MYLLCQVSSSRARVKTESIAWAVGAMVGECAGRRARNYSSLDSTALHGDLDFWHFLLPSQFSATVPAVFM